MNQNIQKLNIEGRFLYYNEIELFEGRKVIDKKIAAENLMIFNSILEKTNIKYGLFYGTLLGAIREKDFIEYDEDVDVFMLAEFKSDFFSLLFEFKENGLDVVRVRNHFISLMRNNEYIDVYFFYRRKRFLFRNVRVLNNNFIVKAEYLENTKIIEFLNIRIPIPENPEKVLKQLYGKTWQIPKRGANALPNAFHLKLIRKFPILKEVLFYHFIVRMYKKFIYK